ncbi:MAG: N-acetyl-gamma-glutamyl-phosphate reductase [Nitrospirae bacterium]|nr:MAG: N-acetyl-gamma-glutamyl-phosphate reductase [Nitrospirota bacterium]
MDEKIRVGVIGASGYTGGELLRLLSCHPNVALSAVAASERSSGKAIPALFPNLTHLAQYTIEALDPKLIGQRVDVVFLALPHTTSWEVASAFLDLGRRVIDLSADYRLKNPQLYETWYQIAHPFPDLLTEAVYGLPELHRDAIRHARLVAVPGCYPTAAILQLAPLAARSLIERDGIVIDAKSGVSGAGRTPAPAYHFPEAHEAMHAYKIGSHRHTPEIEQELGQLFETSSLHKDASKEVRLNFTPHLVPMNRGILSTAYARPLVPLSSNELLTRYETFYKQEPFVRVWQEPDRVNPSHVHGANFCDLSVCYDQRTGYVVTLAALDNLVKGAAGQAIQVMNIMLGLPETSGLTMPGLFP